MYQNSKKQENNRNIHEENLGCCLNIPAESLRNT